jgi:NADH-quinone oxidoreductase subunit E
VLMALRLAQDEYGVMDEAVIRAVGSYLELPLAQVSEVASFYSLYRHKPAGKYRLAVCNSISCMLCGSESLIRSLEVHLGIKVGEVTEDGLFSLHETECLAACSMAPALIVNDETYHYNVDEAKAQALINALREADHGA